MNLAALRMMKIPPPVAEDLMPREQAGAETMPDAVQDTVSAPAEQRMTSLRKVATERDIPAPAVALRGRLESSLVGFALGVLSIGGMLLLWYLATKYRLDLYIRFTNIPSPGEVLERVMEVNQSPKFLNNIAISVRRILLGFMLASVLGVVMGVLIGRYRVIRQLSMPALEVLRPIPAIAWVPMAIMLWPSNEVSIVFITFIGAFFPILLNTVHGVEEIDDVLLRAARCLGTREIDLLMYVVIPGALQHIFTGLAVGMGVAWVSLIAAEMISGQFGIGYFTWEAYSLISYSEIALGMITIGVLGLLCSGAIRLCAKMMMPWMHCNGGRA